MPSRLFNLARMTVASAPGTGNITLSAAVPGFLTFLQSGVLYGQLVRYAVKDGNAREVGIATFSSSGPSLTGRAVLKSTNADALLNLSANAIVGIVEAAEDFGTIAPQCGRLTSINTTNLSFAPKNGDKIKINGKLYEIPSGGLPGLANTGVIVNGAGGANLVQGTYLVTACIVGGVPTGAFNTNITHNPSTAVDNEGVEIGYLGDSHTVIGLLRTTSASQFNGNQTLSWFNRRFKEIHFGVGNLSTTSGSWVDLTGATDMIHWGDEPFWLMFSGQGFDSHPSGFGAMDIGVDSANAGLIQYIYQGLPAGVPVNLAGFALGYSEGYHYITGRGVAASGGGTMTINNATLGWGTFG